MSSRRQSFDDTDTINDEMLYTDSSDEDDFNTEKNELLEDNTRYLLTDKHCFNPFESVMIEISMLAAYICIIASIASILIASKYGSRHRYFIALTWFCILANYGWMFILFI